MWPVVVIGFVGAAKAIQIAYRQWRLRTIAERVADALADPANDLSQISRELRIAVTSAFFSRLDRRRTPHGMGGPHQVDQREQDLRLLRGLVGLELGELSVAEYESSRCGLADAAARILRLRMDLARGVSPSVILDEEQVIAPFGEVLRSDTRAKLALLRAEPAEALSEHTPPLTRARALAALGRDDEASTLLRGACAARIEAVCRLYPRDPVTRIASMLRRPAGPYR